MGDIMKYESKVLTNEEITKNIVDVINQYKNEIIKDFENPMVIEIVSVKVDITNNNVYITYNDYTEEQNKLQNIMSEGIIIKTKLDEELSKENIDSVKVSLLQNKLVELSKEFERLKPILKIEYEFCDII